MRRACLRLFSVTAVALAVVAAVGCSQDDDDDRKCADALTAYARPTDGASCSTAQTVNLSFCERLSTPHCPAGTPPSFACVSDENGNGLILQLAPCATLDSIPLSVAFADDHYAASPNAIPDCNAAANTCDQGTLTGIVGDDVPSGVDD